MVESVYTQLSLINPYRLWQAQSYSNVSGYDNHAYICFDCIGFLHYANTYNILISSMSTDSVSNTVVVNDSRISNDSDSKSDCDDLVNDIFNNLCVVGVHCVIRYTDEWIDSDLDERANFHVGSQKTITVWAEQGFCDKNSDSKLISSFTPQMFL